MIDIVTAIRGVFAKSTRYQPPPVSPAARSHDVGVQAAQLHIFMTINVHKDAYAHRTEKMERMLAELAGEGSFNLAQFDAGYKSVLDLPYDRKHDFLKLQERMPGVFEVDGVSSVQPVAP